MYEIREGMKQINGIATETFERDVFEGDAHLEVEAGTTGFTDDARAYVRITAVDADFFARVKTDDAGKPRGIEIAVSGNEEVMALLKALGFSFRAMAEGCEE